MGRAGVLAAGATLDAIKALAPLRTELATAIAEAANVTDAGHRTANIYERWRHDTALGDSIFVPRAMSWMAGQLMVWGPESKLSTPGKRMEARDAQSNGAFLNKPWPEALQAFRDRGIVDENELSTLLKDMAHESGDARRSMLDRIQEAVRGMLEDAIEQGQTFDEFADKLRAGADGLGITATDPSYLQMVFRTNVNGAYAEGRKAAMEDPDIHEARPFVQYRAVMDARTSENHAILDGLVFRITDPLWREVAPLKRPNCRCSMITLSADEADGLEIAEELPAGYEPE